MRSLPRPTITGVSVLKLCASSIRSDELKARLALVEDAIASAELEYIEYGESGSLYRISEKLEVGGHLTCKEMQRVYNGTFVKSTRTRGAYASLKAACENGVCPLCGQGTVHQLDHYLPITRYPVFGVTAVNLVPACSDCNKNKETHVPKSADEQTMHPYFDAEDAERWLLARVQECKPAALVFSVNAPKSWGKVQSARMETHFRIYRLGALYASHAAVEINNMRYVLQKLAQSRGSAVKISKYLSERAEGCARVHKNSWQSATLEALASSEWYCSGGFNSV